MATRFVDARRRRSPKFMFFSHERDRFTGLLGDLRNGDAQKKFLCHSGRRADEGLVTSLSRAGCGGADSSLNYNILNRREFL